MNRIMFYINTVGHGGAERVITNLADKFSECGYEVTLVTSYKLDWEYPCSDKVTRVVLSPIRFESRLKKNIILTRGLRKTLNKYKPDVLVSFMGENNFRAITACMGTKTECVVSVRNDPDREYRNKINRFLAKFLYRFSKGVIFQTKDAKEWFPEYIQKKSEVIVNHVDKAFYGDRYAGERKDIVTTGRLVPQKNHELLIDAYAKIAPYIQDNLYIYGDGQYKKQLQEKIDSLNLSNRVFLPGAVSNVAEIVKQAKVFVLSSDYEGLPNALMEAMVLGVACVSTDCPCGGPAYLIESGKEGLLVPCKDKDSLAKAVKTLVDDDILREKLGKAAMEKSMEFYPDEVFKKWKSFLEGVKVNEN